MKIMIITLLLLTFTAPAFAQPIDGSERTERLLETVSDFVTNMKGINGIGVTGCNPTTGERFDSEGPWVHCLVINTESKEAFIALSILFPKGTRVDGVFVVVDYIGPIEAQPRMSAGD